MEVKKPLALYDFQLTGLNRAIEILQLFPYYIDMSDTGSGKTFITAAIARYFGFGDAVVVLCPANARSTWISLSEEYDVELKPNNVVSFDSLTRSQTGKNLVTITPADRDGNPSMPVDPNATSFDRKYYHSAPWWKKICGIGVLLIIDEAHSVKNKSGRTAAVTAMVNTLLLSNSKSRVAFLTASMADREDNLIQFAKLLGIVTEEGWKSNPMYGSQLTGILQFHNWYQYMWQYYRDYLPPPKANASDYLVSRGKLATSVLPHFTKLIQLHSFTVENPSIERRCYRGFFRIDDPNEYKAVTDASRILAVTVIYFYQGRVDFSRITQALMQLENSQVNAMTRVVMGWLQEEPQSKVVVAVNFRNTFHQIASLLHQFGYAILGISGDTNINDRIKIIKAFNTNPVVKILIVTVQTSSASISLHDTVGDAPRRMLISPTFNMTNIYQMTGRIFRTGQKSIGRAYVFYPLIENPPDRIITSLATKSKILNSLFGEAKTEKYFPGGYPRYYQGYGYLKEEESKRMDLVPDPKLSNLQDLWNGNLFQQEPTLMSDTLKLQDVIQDNMVEMPYETMIQPELEIPDFDELSRQI